MNLSGSDMTVFFSVCSFFFHYNAHVVLHHLANDDTCVPWHQWSIGLHLSRQIWTPQVLWILDAASSLNVRVSCARPGTTYAGFRALLTAPYQTGFRAHQTWDTSCSNKGRTAVCLICLAVCLWHHRQVCVCELLRRPLLRTFVAAVLCRLRWRRATSGLLEPGTIRLRLWADARLWFVIPSVGYLHVVGGAAYLIFY